MSVPAVVTAAMTILEAEETLILPEVHPRALAFSDWEAEGVGDVQGVFVLFGFAAAG
jgi:hypothetical protein